MAKLAFWDIFSGKKLADFRTDLEVPHTLATAFAVSPDGRYLAAGISDGTILLWEIPLPPQITRPLPEKESISLWKDLGDADAVRAWRAIRRLAESPTEALALLRRHLKPSAGAEEKVTAPLIADLGSDSFPRRKSAQQKLRQLGYRAEPALRKTLKANQSEETRRRIDELLKNLVMTYPLSPEDLRNYRAISVLTWIGTPEARRFLEELARGVPSAPLTQKARGALESFR